MKTFLTKGFLFLFLAVAVVLFSRVTLNAQEEEGIEEKILQKIEEVSTTQAQIIDTQSKIQDALNQVLSNQADIKKELEIVKIRATR